jgi:hypothetical protein
MDRDVGFNPRRGGNCCPAPAAFDQAHGDQVRAETAQGDTIANGFATCRAAAH